MLFTMFGFHVRLNLIEYNFVRLVYVLKCTHNGTTLQYVRENI
jgi:hypothetical protein